MGLNISSRRNKNNLMCHQSARRMRCTVVRHPIIIGTISLLATALPSAAFAATQSSSSIHHPFAMRPLFIRGGQKSIVAHSRARHMSNKQGYPSAPTQVPTMQSPFNRPIKKVTVVGGTHGNEYTVSDCCF